MVTPPGRIADVKKTVAGNHPDRVPGKIVILERERHNILRLMVQIEILSVGIPPDVGGIPAEPEFIKSLRAQRMRERNGMLDISLGKSIRAVGDILKLELIAGLRFDMLQRCLHRLGILVDRDRGGIGVGNFQRGHRFPGQLAEPGPVVAGTRREKRAVRIER